MIADLVYWRLFDFYNKCVVLLIFQWAIFIDEAPPILILFKFVDIFGVFTSLYVFDSPLNLLKVII